MGSKCQLGKAIEANLLTYHLEIGVIRIRKPNVSPEFENNA